jgi:hypothetical protein
MSLEPSLQSAASACGSVLLSTTGHSPLSTVVYGTLRLAHHRSQHTIAGAAIAGPNDKK